MTGASHEEYVCHTQLRTVLSRHQIKVEDTNMVTKTQL